MNHASHQWRYVLRNGRLITATVCIGAEHAYVHRCRDGSLLLALLSPQAEALLLSMIREQQVQASTSMHGSSVCAQLGELAQFADATNGSAVVVSRKGIADCNLQAINAPSQQCTAITP